METKQYAAAGPWISVEEALPDSERRVLVRREVDIQTDLAHVHSVHWATSTCNANGAWACDIGDRYAKVTHWAEVRV